MRKPNFRGLVLLAGALLIMCGCVELTGQRITWRHDPVKDELQILIHYDGIHDSPRAQPQGGEQIPEFVQNGDVMLLDWPLRFNMAELRKKIEDENADPQEREWARLITSVRTQPVGYYREPDGRIGAAQLLTIPNAKDFVGRLNRLISRRILAQQAGPDGKWEKTLQRMQSAAKRDHPWITLDGNAIRFRMPVHSGQWVRIKADFLGQLAQEAAGALGAGGDEEQKHRLRSAIRALAGVPFSYVERHDRVEFVLGCSTEPGTWRLDLRDEYEPSLEKAVVDAVQTDLDQALAQTLLDKGPAPPSPIGAVLGWGPPEEPVRAMVAVAEGGDDGRKQAAIEWLGSWAEQWNHERGAPKAPEKVDPVERYLAAWKSWYRQMRQYPVLPD